MRSATIDKVSCCSSNEKAAAQAAATSSPAIKDAPVFARLAFATALLGRTSKHQILLAGTGRRSGHQEISDHALRHSRTLSCDDLDAILDDTLDLGPNLLNSVFKRRSTAILFHGACPL